MVWKQVTPFHRAKLQEKDILNEITCEMCLENFVIVTPSVEWYKWYHGALVQEAFPNMDEDARELFISRTCPECWRKLIEDVHADEICLENWTDPNEQED